MEINLKEVKESFITTTRDLLQRSESLLLDMERQVNPEHYTELLRAVHTIKGNAGIFELDTVIHLCHSFETFLEELRGEGNPLSTELIDTGLTVIDRMRSLVTLIDAREKMSEVPVHDVIAAMENRRKTGTSAKPGITSATPEKSDFDRLRTHTQRLRLPEKYLELARRNNHYLIFVVFDFGDQGNLSLAQLYAKLKVLHKSGNLLSLGVLRKETITNNPSGPFMPYFLILHSAELAETLIERLGLKILLFHYFWQPEHKSNTTVDIQQDSSRSADTHLKETHLKVHLDLLNSLIDITGEIVLTRNALVRKIEQSEDQGLAAFSKKLSYLVSDLQDKVMKTRLQSLDTLFHRFPRLVRETAQLTSKKAVLQIEGGDLEIDKAIIDEIADPLVHIIRNAVDHGLENPAERISLGKPEAGSVVLKAELREGNVVIRVMDDGKGLDLEKIRNTAVVRGLISREAASAAQAAEIAEYLFLPGFSTKTEITTVSGRGVGMDVVRTNISKLGGSVDITGDAGKGTVVTIVIPQTLSILTCLTVEIGDFRFVIPQQNIVEVVTIDPSLLRTIQGKKAYELRQRLLPLIDTTELLELTASGVLPFIIVVRTEKFYFGLLVERIFDTEEVVVKTLPQFGQERQIFSGAAIMGDGKIAPIIDAVLIGKHANLQSGARLDEANQARTAIAKPADQYLLFRVHGRNVAFLITAAPRIETIEPACVENMVGQKVVNYRGEIIPILAIDFVATELSPDHALTKLMILPHAGRRYGILAAEILDIVQQNLALKRENGIRREIDGFALINGEPTVVLNITELFKISERSSVDKTAHSLGSSNEIQPR